MEEAEIRRKYPPYSAKELITSLQIHDKNIASFQTALEKEVQAKAETYKLIEQCEERDQLLAKARKEAMIAQLQSEIQEG